MTEYDFATALKMTQEHISRNYSLALINKTAEKFLRSYIEKYLRDNEICVQGLTLPELSLRIVNEMAGFSILTDLLESDDLEEININSWDDIAVTHRNGQIEKLSETFLSRQHAVDIIKRLLSKSGMIIDNASPVAQGHLPGNTRVTALKVPLVDDNVGVAASIRILKPARIDVDQIVESGFATSEMIDFLCVCARYGVPFVISGATSSGKTTLLNAMLKSIPSGTRIFTIESGSRELSLVRRDSSGRVLNNVVHTLSRPSEKDAFDISQESLVVASLRFNPDIICVGEMRDQECYSAVEASLTGHTVLSTVHSGPGELCHTRIALLCQKRFPIDITTSLAQTAQAFPIVVYTHKLENNERKCMDISECVVNPSTGERYYSSLYSYDIETSYSVENTYFVQGVFVKKNSISDSLKRRLIQFGIPRDVLKRFTGEGRL